MAEVNQCQYCIKDTRIAVKAIEAVYIVLASCFVGHGIYRTIEKMNERNILVKEEVDVVPMIRYPSLTFCYKYTHGSKRAIDTYNSHFAKKWIKSGESYSIFQFTGY